MVFCRWGFARVSLEMARIWQELGGNLEELLLEFWLKFCMNFGKILAGILREFREEKIWMTSEQHSKEIFERTAKILNF